jgi:hypothetical protein
MLKSLLPLKKRSSFVLGRSIWWCCDMSFDSVDVPPFCVPITTNRGRHARFAPPRVGGGAVTLPPAFE